MYGQVSWGRPCATEGCLTKNVDQGLVQDLEEGEQIQH